jgi:hypothetical protein
MFWMALCTGISGCARSIVMPEVDLSSSQWRVWSGQALWEPGRNQPAVVGEILLALHDTGDTYINLAKPPLDIFTAQTHHRSWSVHLIENDKAYRGRGTPPKQFIWFYLPALLADRGSLDARWQVEKLDEQHWTFTDRTNSESIRLVLDG